MKIDKVETPSLWNRLVENEANFEKLVESEKKFNAEMLEKYGIRFGVAIVTDVIIVDTAGRLHIDEELMQELKNVKTNAGRVLAELDKSGKFKEFLELAGAANAPATLGFLKEVGDRVLEKASVNPSATTTPTMKELEDFYKN